MLVKQIPAFEDMELDRAGRLVRTGAALEMSAYCRRAVSKAVELAAAEPASSVTVFTLGPPSAEDVLREAIAWGIDRGVDVRGVLVTDPALAGSDTAATARALAAAIGLEGPFDLILAGRNSLDGDTGQVPPQLAELLDLPFAAGVKMLALDGRTASVGCEHDDGWVEAELALPAVLSCAERLCAPAKVPPEGRTAVPAGAITTLGAADLGPGPWGPAASLTTVGEIRALPNRRLRRIDPDAPLAAQVGVAVGTLRERGVLDGAAGCDLPHLGVTGGTGPVIAVLGESGQDALVRELCGTAARLAESLGGSTVLLASPGLDPTTAGSWGADRLVSITGSSGEGEVAAAVARWAEAQRPWAILAGSTTSGREIAARVAVSIGAGLTGDAIDVEVCQGRLLAWKPAFGGSLVAAVTATSPVQMATLRPGVSARPRPRVQTAEATSVIAVPRGRIRVRLRRQEDSLERLGEAGAVIGIGAGVAPGELPRLTGLREALGAELACTRKVTDRGGMPHSSQVGITGRSIAPRLYVAIGTSGKFNHMVGVRSAGTVLAINSDAAAPIWEHTDVGIVADWRDCVDMLEAALRAAVTPHSGGATRTFS